MAWYKKAFKKVNKATKGISKTIRKVENVGKKVTELPVVGTALKEGFAELKRSDPRVAAAAKVAKETSQVAKAGEKGGLVGIAKQQYQSKGRDYLAKRGVNVGELERGVSAVRSGGGKAYAQDLGKRMYESNKPLISEMKQEVLRRGSEAVSSGLDRVENKISDGIKPLTESNRVQDAKDLFLEMRRRR